MVERMTPNDRSVSIGPEPGRVTPRSGAPAGCDVAVVGAGVVGAAVARRFQLDGASVVVLEAAREVLDGASKGNSGILHTGFDAPVGSVEARCVVEGREEYLAIRDALGLPLLRTGALVLAWDDEQAGRLPELLAQAGTRPRRSLYLHLPDQWHAQEKERQFLYTPPVQVLHALDAALDEFFAEGATVRHARYAACHAVLLAGMKRLGFACLVPPAWQSRLTPI